MVLDAPAIEHLYDNLPVADKPWWLSDWFKRWLEMAQNPE